jgi:hypothetical protein
MSVQNEALGGVPESPFDQLNFDLRSEAVFAFPHGDIKCEELVRRSFRLVAAGV